MSILNNTTALQNEQTELQNLLASVNALPEAGSGGENLDAEISAQETLISEQDAKITELAEILSSKASVSYPTLSNPATAENLQEGYQLIDESGNVVTGTHVCSGGSAETCTVTIAGMPEVDIMYYSNGSEFVEHSNGVYPGDSFIVAKNTMIYFDTSGYGSGWFDEIENVKEIFVNTSCVVLAIYGDCTIEL